MGAGAVDETDRPFAILAESPMLNFLFHLSAGEKIDPVRLYLLTQVNFLVS